MPAGEPTKQTDAEPLPFNPQHTRRPHQTFSFGINLQDMRVSGRRRFPCPTFQLRVPMCVTDD